MSNKVKKQQQREEKKQLRQSKLLRSSWVNFDQFRIIKNSKKDNLSNDNQEMIHFPVSIANFVI